MTKRLLLSLFGSIVFYGLVNGIFSKYCNNTVDLAVYIGIVLVVGLTINELGSFTSQELKRDYPHLLMKLFFIWVFGFIGTFIALNFHPVLAIVTLTILAEVLNYLNASRRT